MCSRLAGSYAAVTSAAVCHLRLCWCAQVSRVCSCRRWRPWASSRCCSRCSRPAAAHPAAEAPPAATAVRCTPQTNPKPKKLPLYNCLAHACHPTDSRPGQISFECRHHALSCARRPRGKGLAAGAAGGRRRAGRLCRAAEGRRRLHAGLAARVPGAPAQRLWPHVSLQGVLLLYSMCCWHYGRPIPAVAVLQHVRQCGHA
jgi:hypothetical protein